MDFKAEHALIEVVTNLCGPSSNVYRGDTGGDGVSKLTCSFESEAIVGHDITRGTPFFSCNGLQHLRGTTGLISASAGEPDRVRLLIQRGLIFIPAGSGLEILRLGMRNPVDRIIKLSSRLSWEEYRARNGESGRGSSPVTS